MCDEPAALLNGRRLSTTGNSIGDVIEWECETGYRLNGNPTSVCRLVPGDIRPTFTASPVCTRKFRHFQDEAQYDYEA